MEDERGRERSKTKRAGEKESGQLLNLGAATSKLTSQRSGAISAANGSRLGKLAEGPSRCNPKGTCAYAASGSRGTGHFFVPYCTEYELLVLVASPWGFRWGAFAGKLFLGGSFLVERFGSQGLDCSHQFGPARQRERERELETGL